MEVDRESIKSIKDISNIEQTIINNSSNEFGGAYSKVVVLYWQPFEEEYIDPIRGPGPP